MSDAGQAFTTEIFQIITQDPTSIARWLATEVRDNPLHVTVELVCIVFVIYLWRQKPFIPDKQPPGEEPTQQEKEELIEQWCSRPAPVLPDEGDHSKVRATERVVAKAEGDFLEYEGGERCFDCATFNFLRMSTNERVVADSLAAVEHYGVGSCGPRGFYGTVQPHLVLEEKLRDVFGTQAAIIYSFQYTTTASIIPAFAARKDVLVVDKSVNTGVAAGVELSRANVHWFDHNDMGQLEAILADIDAKQRKAKKLTRRWIVTEGLFRNVGDTAPLAEIVALKQRYKFRLVVDDSYGVGVLGRTGRGTPEECGLATTDCDVYVGSLDAALGSVGGFCVGTNMVVDHQRLSSAGYCFSASLPPYCAVAATTALDLMTENPAQLATLRANAAAMRAVLRKEGFELAGGADVPLMHVTAPKAAEGLARRELEEKFEEAVACLQKEGVAVARPIYTDTDRHAPPPSLRLTASATATTAQATEAAEKIAEVVKKVFA